MTVFGQHCIGKPAPWHRLIPTLAETSRLRTDILAIAVAIRKPTRLWMRPGIAAHWRLGQLIPVWANSPVMGHGSPSPILYHKAFPCLPAFYPVFTGRKVKTCWGSSAWIWRPAKSPDRHWPRGRGVPRRLHVADVTRATVPRHLSRRRVFAVLLETARVIEHGAGSCLHVVACNAGQEGGWTWHLAVPCCLSTLPSAGDPRVHIMAPEGRSVVTIDFPPPVSTFVNLTRGVRYRRGSGCGGA